MTCRAILVALLLAAPLAADETTLLVEPSDWELLPLDELELRRLQRDEAGLVRRLRDRAQQIEGVRKALDQRADPDDEESRRLREQIEAARSDLVPDLLRLTEVLAGHGVDAEALTRIRATPPGPNRAARHAHRLVREAVTAPERRAVADALVSAVDGAQLAFVARRQRAERAAGQGEEARAAIRPALEDAEAHRREVERRFWLVVDCLLDDAEKIEVRRFLPNEFDRYADPVGHAYRLPGMTPAQAARLRALVSELDSEAAADRAEEKRLGAALREQGLPAEKRGEITRALEETRGRLLDLDSETAAAGKALLSPEQLAAFQAIPPFIGPNDRNLRPEVLLTGLRLDDAQKRRLAELRRALEEGRRAYEQELGEIRKLGAETSPDAPQDQKMEMMTLALQGEGQVAMRALARRLYVEVLTPGQVVDWVLGIDETLIGGRGLDSRR